VAQPSAKAGLEASLKIHRPQGGRETGKTHQFLWRVSQLVIMRMRDSAVRNDEKPFRTESSNAGEFRACVNRSYPEGIRLLLCISTVRTTLADDRKATRPMKNAERRNKRSVRAGKDTRTGQVP
jgi:hypothetical protein